MLFTPGNTSFKMLFFVFFFATLHVEELVIVGRGGDPGGGPKSEPAVGIRVGVDQLSPTRIAVSGMPGAHAIKGRSAGDRTITSPCASQRSCAEIDEVGSGATVVVVLQRALRFRYVGLDQQTALKYQS